MDENKSEFTFLPEEDDELKIGKLATKILSSSLDKLYEEIKDQKEKL